MYIGASDNFTTASLSLFQCSSPNCPVRNTCWSKRPTEPSIRITNCVPPISIENTATGKCSFTATCSAIFIENAVLPIDGRPATMIKSPTCKPDVRLSKSIKPVEVPVTSSGLSREYSISMRSTTSFNKFGIFKKPCCPRLLLSAI